MKDEQTNQPADPARPEVPPLESGPPAPPGHAEENGQAGPPSPPDARDAIKQASFKPAQPSQAIVPADKVPAAGATPASAAASKGKDSPREPKDGFREIVETVVFVVVLVLLLKSFVAEAFVIPTGSMATTLLGYHREVECPECKYTFPINMSSQLDAENPHPAMVTGCVCPNCFLSIQFPGALAPWLREEGRP
jgi:hypothetical protein